MTSLVRFGLFTFAFIGSLCPVDAAPIILWHNQSGQQARFFQKVVGEFNASGRFKEKIQAETGLELESILIPQIDSSVRPDMLFIPSDMIGLYRELYLSEIPSSWKRAQTGIPDDVYQLLTFEGKIYGIPVLGGNHLVLFYNKSHVSVPAKTWQELRDQGQALRSKGIKLIGWPFLEPYYFLPFLQSLAPWTPEQLNTNAMESALSAYHQLTVSGLISAECGQDCNTSRFYRGEFAYAISGDWAVADAKLKLGNRLGIADLPKFGERPLLSGRGLQCLVFSNPKTFSKHRALFLEFGRFLQSEAIQSRWASEALRKPLHKAVATNADDGRATLIPSSKATFYAWLAMKQGLSALRGKTPDFKAIARQIQDVFEQIARTGLQQNAGKR